MVGGGGEWYREAGRVCCRERSCAWAVKPGASHDGKLLLHCLVTRSGIIGLARALAGFFARPLRRGALAREAGANTALAASRLAVQQRLQTFWETSMCVYMYY